MIRLVDGYGEDDLEKSVRYRLITQPEEAETRCTSAGSISSTARPTIAVRCTTS